MVPRYWHDLPLGKETNQHRKGFVLNFSFIVDATFYGSSCSLPNVRVCDCTRPLTAECELCSVALRGPGHTVVVPKWGTRHSKWAHSVCPPVMAMLTNRLHTGCQRRKVFGQALHVGGRLHYWVGEGLIFFCLVYLVYLVLFA